MANDTLYALPTGDPSFLNAEFSYQPVIDLLKKYHLPTIFSNENWKDERYGYGWAWDDYNEDYMAERNALPINANLGKIMFWKSHEIASLYPDIINRGFYYKVNYNFEPDRKKVLVKRKPTENTFDVYFGKASQNYSIQIPLVTNGISSSLEILHSLYGWISKNDSAFNIQHLTFNLNSSTGIFLTPHNYSQLY